MRRLFIILVNSIVFAAVLILLELGARIYSKTPILNAKTSSSPAISLAFMPYLMTGQVPNNHYVLWLDAIRNRNVNVDVTTNNAGFPTSREFNIASPYVKRANEKTVLLTGGSTAFGVGATSNANITDQKLEHFLNAAQTDVHYTLVNLAQGGWIAEQEAIALDLWGRLFQPDWIITLDGVNDFDRRLRDVAGNRQPGVLPGNRCAGDRLSRFATASRILSRILGK